SRRRHTRFSRDWSSDVCSSDLSGTRRGRAMKPRKKGNPKAARKAAASTKSPGKKGAAKSTAKAGGMRESAASAKSAMDAMRASEDRKSVVQEKSVYAEGRRILK